MDGASNEIESGASMMLITCEGHKINYALHFGFTMLNNKAEYEALIMGLHLVRELWVCNLKIYSDSQLVVNQVNDVYLVRGERMAAYLEKAKKLMEIFPTISVEVILWAKNVNVYALAKPASMKDAELLDAVSIEFLAKPSIGR